LFLPILGGHFVGSRHKQLDTFVQVHDTLQGLGLCPN
jgi:hypothetical protein